MEGFEKNELDTTQYSERWKNTNPKSDRRNINKAKSVNKLD